MNYLKLLLTLFSYTVCAVTHEELPIAVLTPKNDGDCIKTSVEMAIDDVNSVENFILNTNGISYKLRPYFGAVESEPKYALAELNDLFHNQNKTMIGLIGPPLTQQHKYCQQFIMFKSTITFSYSEADEPVPEKRDTYFSTSPSISESYTALKLLFMRFNWSRIAVITDFGALRYQKNVNMFLEIMAEKQLNHTMEILTIQGIWGKPNISQPMEIVQAKGARIIPLLMTVDGARKVFCEAYHRQMFAPKVTWILFEDLPSDWASDKYNSNFEDGNEQGTREIDCTESQLLQIAKGHIALTRQTFRTDGSNTISNQTVKDFKKRLNARLPIAGVKCDGNVAHAYDAVWGLAQVARDFQLRRKTPFSKYTYGTALTFFDDLQDFLGDIDFQGLTGDARFTYTTHRNFRIGVVSIKSNQGSETKIAGTYDSHAGNLSLYTGYERILFQNGIVPKDEAAYEESSVYFAKPLLLTMWTINSLGIMLAIALMVTVFAWDLYRNGMMQQSSILDGMVCIGSVLCYASAIIYGIDTRFVGENNIRYVCGWFLCSLSLGFSLVFGSLFAKEWQTYKLYLTPQLKVNKTRMTQRMSGWYMLIFISLLIVIDAAIIVSWFGTSPFEKEHKTINDQEDLFKDVIVIEKIVGCTSCKQGEFMIGIYCYKGIVLLLGILIAFQITNSKAQFQNNSKGTAMAIYNVAALATIGVICVSVLENTTRYQATYSIIAVCICICTSTTLLLIYIPKIKSYINSNGTFINTQRSDPSTNVNDTGNFTMKYLRRSMEKKKSRIEPAVSSVTLTTEAPIEPTPQPCGSLDNSVFTGSLPSINRGYLSGSPPSYDSNEVGIVKLNPAVSGVERIEEEPDVEYEEECEVNAAHMEEGRVTAEHDVTPTS